MELNALDRVLNPILKEDFFLNYWESKHFHLYRNDPLYFNNLVSINDIDSYISRNDLRYPAIRMVKDGGELPLDEYSTILNFGRYSSPGLLNGDKIIHFFQEGATILIQLARSSFPALASFSNQLQAELGFNVEANIYLTPRNSQGFTTHYDTHSVLVLQLFGTKTWRIYNTLKESPLLEDTFTSDDFDGSPHNEEIIMYPGDVLYVPRGLGHDARSTSEDSIHITVGLFPTSWIDLLAYYSRQLSNYKEWRKAPVGLVSRDNQFNIVKKFRELIMNINDGDILDAICNVEQFHISKQSQLNNGRLSVALKQQEIDPSMVVQVTPNLIYRIVNDEQGFGIEFYDKKIDLPSDYREFVFLLIKEEPVELANTKSSLDTEDFHALVELLLNEGFIIKV